MSRNLSAIEASAARARLQQIEREHDDFYSTRLALNGRVVDAGSRDWLAELRAEANTLRNQLSDDAQAIDNAPSRTATQSAPIDGPFGHTFTFADPDGY